MDGLGLFVKVWSGLDGDGGVLEWRAGCGEACLAWFSGCVSAFSLVDENMAAHCQYHLRNTFIDGLVNVVKVIIH